jgi:hypothetical protein
MRTLLERWEIPLLDGRNHALDIAHRKVEMARLFRVLGQPAAAAEELVLAGMMRRAVHAGRIRDLVHHGDPEPLPWFTPPDVVSRRILHARKVGVSMPTLPWSRRRSRTLDRLRWWE